RPRVLDQFFEDDKIFLVEGNRLRRLFARFRLGSTRDKRIQPSLPIELPSSVFGLVIVKIRQRELCVANPEDPVVLEKSTLQQLIEIQLKFLAACSRYTMKRVVAITVPNAASNSQPESWNFQSFSREDLFSRMGSCQNNSSA